MITIRCTRSRGPRGFFCLQDVCRGPVNVAVIQLDESHGNQSRLGVDNDSPFSITLSRSRIFGLRDVVAARLRVRSRCNSLETVVCRSSAVVFSPLDYPDSGPIREYAADANQLYIRTVGRTPRSLFAGDTFENVDETQTFFFAVAPSSDTVIGPLSEQDFATQFGNLDSFNWKQPRHPLQYIVFAILGSCVLIPFAIIGALIWFIFRKRKPADAG